MEDRSGRSLVDATRLDANEAVLDHVDSTDPMLAGNLVQIEIHRQRFTLNVPIVQVDHPCRDRVLEVDLELGRFIWRIEGRAGQIEHVGGWSRVGILEQPGFIALVHEVLIHAVGLFGCGFDRNPLLLGVTLIKSVRPLKRSRNARSFQGAITSSSGASAA